MWMKRNKENRYLFILQEAQCQKRPEKECFVGHDCTDIKVMLKFFWYGIGQREPHMERVQFRCLGAYTERELV